MGKLKRLQQIESDLFDVIEKLNRDLRFKNKDSYKLHLVVMDELNEEYNSLSGKYYIPPLTCLQYYEKMWSI